MERIEIQGCPADFSIMIVTGPHPENGREWNHAPIIPWEFGEWGFYSPVEGETPTAEQMREGLRKTAWHFLELHRTGKTRMSFGPDVDTSKFYGTKGL